MRLLILILGLASAAARGASVDVLLAASTDAELDPIIKRLEDPEQYTRAAWTFWSGTIAGKSVAIVRTEGDPLNAVAATTLAIRLYQPSLVITFGSARSLDPALRTGNVVVAGGFVAYDGAFTPVAPLGGGSNPLTWFRLPHALVTPGERETPTEIFPADPAAATRLGKATGRVAVANLGSANQVNREADRVAWIHEKWDVATEDGESAHIAATAQLLGVPAAGLRVIEGEPGAASKLVLGFLEAKP